jgi:hypothetical protein
MSDYENFGFEVDGDGIAVATWDMPDRSMNVLSQSSMKDLSDIIEKVASDDAIKGLVLTSGKSAFCAGADLSMMGSNAGGSAGASEQDKVKALYEGNIAFNMQLRRMETCGKPIAAAITGTALGGGLEVTLACHARFVADNPRPAGPAGKQGRPAARWRRHPASAAHDRRRGRPAADPAGPGPVAGKGAGLRHRQQGGPGGQAGGRSQGVDQGRPCC